MSTIKSVKEPDQIPGIKFNIENLVKTNILEKEKVKLFVNAFPIKFNKDIKVHKYPFTIEPETNEEYIVSKIFGELSMEILKTYGNFYREGNCFYSVKEVLTPKDFTATIIDKGKIEYSIRVDNKAETTTIKKGQTTGFSKLMKKLYF